MGLGPCACANTHGTRSSTHLEADLARLVVFDCVEHVMRVLTGICKQNNSGAALCRNTRVCKEVVVVEFKVFFHNFYEETEKNTNTLSAGQPA